MEDNRIYPNWKKVPDWTSKIRNYSRNEGRGG
jgi:hypothetical protein